MAKVIFEINSCNLGADASQLTESCTIKVSINEIAQDEQGPHIVLAHITKAKSPVVIKEASSELLKALNEMGAEASGELFQTVRH